MEYKLSDLFDLQMGKTPDRHTPEYWTDGTEQWISISDLSKCDKYIEETAEAISEQAINDSGIKIIPASTVIMSFKLSIGKVAITPKPMYSNEAIMAFIDKGVIPIEPAYLYFLLKAKDWDEGTNKAVMGKTLNKATLSQVKVHIHDMAEQRKIIRALEKAESMVTTRRQQLTALDTLIKARFIELFGDPVHNAYGLPTKKLSCLGLLDRGRSKHRPRNAPELLNGPYPLIQTGEVSNSGLYITEYQNTYSELGLRQSKMWKAGTLCITIAANIAQTAILSFDACFPDSVVGFVPGEDVSAVYMHYWFSFFQKILESQAPQVAQKNINLKILSDLDVAVPTVVEQENFTAFVEQTNKSKAVVQAAHVIARNLHSRRQQKCRILNF